MKLIWGILAAVMLAGLTPAALAGGVVRLREKSVVDDAAVRVGDIATLSGMGKEAESLAEIVIVETLPKEGARVKAEQVLFAIAAARGTKIAADMQVSGSAECLVVHKGEESRFATLAQPAAGGTGAAKTSSSNRTVTAETPRETPAAPTVAATQAKAPAANGAALGQLITERLSTDLEASKDDLRVDFETISPWLDTPIPATQRWQFRALSRGLGSIQFDTQLLEGTRVVAKQMILAKVTKRQMVVTAAATIGRGDILAAKDLKEEEMWLDRKLPTLALKISDVAGLEATRSIASGTMIDTRDIKAAELAARGDMITIYAVSGNLVVKGSARAQDPGKLHDSIRVRNELTQAVYPATLIGKRVAIVGPAVDAETEKRIKEMQ
jgi:flagella basal body P-ring formation protein FlgA